MKNKLINVIGLGYIGLPTAAILAKEGFKVFGTDIDQKTVATINKGKSHILEPELDMYVSSAILSGNLKASTIPKKSDVYIICVPTPFYNNHKSPKPNISYILTAVKNIAKLIKPNDLIILESTSPVGTTKRIQDELTNAGVINKDVHIAYCPERVLPGKIIEEFIDNDRIVGGLTKKATKLASEFYKTFVKGLVLETDAKTAEMCKLTENSFRDINIAFANELSMICDKEKIQVWDLIQLANHHPRVNILQPGPGVGGHCIAVDPWFIVNKDFKNSKLIRTSRKVNNNKTNWVIDKIKIAAEDLKTKTGIKPTIACFGLAFKPNINDLRESPALQIVLSLNSQGYEVLAVEPNIDTHEILKLVTIKEALIQADIIAILVKHKDFIKPSVKKDLINKSSLDFCGALIF